MLRYVISCAATHARHCLHMQTSISLEFAPIRDHASDIACMPLGKHSTDAMLTVCVITVHGVRRRHMGPVPTKWAHSQLTSRGNRAPESYPQATRKVAATWCLWRGQAPSTCAATATIEHGGGDSNCMEACMASQCKSQVKANVKQPSPKQWHPK